MTITISPRETTKSVNACRRDGAVPGVVYGPKIEQALVCAPERDLMLSATQLHGQLASYSFNGQSIEAILQEVQRDPITNRVIHFDLYAPALDRAITTSVPLTFLHEDEIEKRGFMLNKNILELELEALPKNIPQRIEVDLSPLQQAHQSLYIRDLALPTNVKVSLDPDTPVVTLLTPEQA